MEHQGKSFILCRPHNPVGRVWTREELQRIGEVCIKHDVFVVSDEIHCDFVFDLAACQAVYTSGKQWLDAGHIFGMNAGQFQRLVLACPKTALEKALLQLKLAAEQRVPGSS